MYFGNQKINDRWNWHNEFQYRNYNLIGDLEQLLIRTGVGYNLTENNNNLLLGYGFIASEPYVGTIEKKINTTEHRIFQQFISKQQFSRFFIQHRYRFEQRFIESNFRARFRYFLSLNLPVNSKEITKNSVYISTYNEIFVSTSGNHFDRNRLYGGIGYCLTKNLKIEAGVMTQMLANSNRNQFQIIFFNNLPF